MSQSNEDNLDMLNELAEGEDEFDVDLMACGCRLAAEPGLNLSIYDIVRLYNLGPNELIAMIGGLIDAGNIDARTIHQVAERAARGEILEADPRGKSRSTRPLRFEEGQGTEEPSQD